jgi:hypothetical protein
LSGGFLGLVLGLALDLGVGALGGGFDRFALGVEDLGEAEMGVGVGGVVGEGVAEALLGAGKIAVLERAVGGVGGDLGALAIHVGAHQVCGFFTFQGGLGGLVLLDEDGGEGEVRIGLLGELAGGLAQGGGGLGEFVEMVVDAAEGGPAVAVLGAEVEGALELGGGLGVTRGLEVEGLVGSRRWAASSSGMASASRSSSLKARPRS